VSSRSRLSTAELEAVAHELRGQTEETERIPSEPKPAASEPESEPSVPTEPEPVNTLDDILDAEPSGDRAPRGPFLATAEPVAANVAQRERKLTAFQREILDAIPSHGVTIEQDAIARATGIHKSHLRPALDRLVVLGLVTLVP
jgi:hypothetical protein